MKRKRIVSVMLVAAMAATLFAGCGKNGGNGSTQGGSASKDGKIKEFTAFFAVPGSEINDDNEVQQIMADRPDGRRSSRNAGSR